MPATQAAILAAPQAAVAVGPFDPGLPGPGDALVRMEACGICHSDLMISRLPKLPRSPLVLGHEAIGRIVETGDEVSGFAPGDRVGITFLASVCRQCGLCRAGRERYCLKQQNTGYTRDGALAGMAVISAGNLVRIPEGLDPQRVAPLCCAGWTSYCAVREAGLAPRALVGIFGLGGLGHLGVQYARHRGLRVAAVDVAESKLELARELGAEITVAAAGAGRSLMKQHGGVDAAVVFAAVPEAVDEAFRAVRRTGTVVVAGLLGRSWEFPLSEAVLKGVAVRGSFLGSREDLVEVFRLATLGIGLPHVHTHALAETPTLLDRLSAGEVAGRAVVVF
ncbi:MAG: alcohol dehydrogenase catalytic domain-containing protein [Bryobacteraceae bacterium]